MYVCVDVVYNNKFSYMVRSVLGVRTYRYFKNYVWIGKFTGKFLFIENKLSPCHSFFYYAGVGCLVAHLMKSRIKKASANKYILIKALRISSSIVLVHFCGFVAGECEKYSIYVKWLRSMKNDQMRILRAFIFTVAF